MEMLVRIVLWSACFIFCSFFYKKRMGKEFNLKCEIAFSIVSSYAILIVIRSVTARISQKLSLGEIVEESIVIVCMLAAYGVYTAGCKWLLKDDYLRWKFYFSSMQFVLSLGVFLIVGTVTREIYFVLFLLVFVISIIVIKWRGSAIEISSNRVWKTRLKYSLPVSLFVGTTFFVYLPSELYFGNPNVFLVEYGIFIWPMLVEFILFGGAYLLITLVFTTKQHYYLCNNFCMVFTLLANLQHMFLNGNMQQMDGTQQVWATGKIVVNYGIWLVVFVCVVIINRIAQKKLRNVFKIVGYCGFCIQLISLMALAVITLPTLEFDNFVLSKEDAFEMAPENNVFVFVLDSYDNQNIEQILEQDPAFLEPLDGFVRYANTTGKYAFTDLGVPYLLTGEEVAYEYKKDNYAFVANQNSTVLEEIAEAGYTIGLYTEAGFISQNEYMLVENGRYTNRTLGISAQMEALTKASRYKSFPFGLKNFFTYSDDDFVEARRTDVELHNVYNDAPFAKQLLEEKISIDETKKAVFKFYHLHGAHTPYYMNEEFENEETDIVTQAKGCMKIVFEFIDQLKKNDLYEDATIIITADHGMNFFDRPERAYELGMDIMSCPIIFVKNAGDAGTELVTSNAPVSHNEIIPTYMQAMIGNSQHYGRTVEEIGENEVREREFIFGRHDDIPFVKYRVNGNAMDVNNWSEPEELMK